MKKHDVVITQFGFVSPLGSTEEEFTARLFSGSSGVRSLYDYGLPSSFPVPYAAYIRPNEIPPTEFFKDTDPAKLLKSWIMSAAAMESLLKKEKEPLPFDAIIYGTADGVNFESIYELLKNKSLEGFNWQKARSESSLTVLSEILQAFHYPPVAEDKHYSINSACASGNNVIGMAFEGIQGGRWERCLVGGVDARCDASNCLNFNMLGALTVAPVPPAEASRPFSVDRAGFVRGEGAAVLLMETKESARRRHAKILAEVRGYGITSDAFRLTDGRDDGSAVVHAMKTALDTAGLKPSDIQYINAHGTSTALNDRLETQAIKCVFGDLAPNIPISSLKSQIGHATVAASALEAIACIIMLNSQRVAPTINFKPGDPDCDLDYVPFESRSMPLRNILSNSFGFGGQNTCVVFSKGENS